MEIPEARNSLPGICGSFDNSVIYANINDLAERSVRNILLLESGLRTDDMQSLVVVQCHL